jgi:glutamate transport system substrate-binding protein
MTARPLRLSLLSLLLVPLVLIGTSCGGGSSKSAAPSKAPKFPAGSTMDAIQMRGKLRVGIKFDQPLFGLKSPTSGKVEGFDADIAREVAKGIYGDVKNIDGKIDFIEAVSKNREPFLENGTVDIVVATYTINATRKLRVDFAGPYFLAHEDTMVRKNDDSIKSVNNLNGKKVCSAQGSTSLKNVQEKAPQSDTSITFDVYSLCAAALGDGRVQAVVTDNSILAGLVQVSDGKYKLVNAPFSDEPYGIGLKKGDATFRNWLNDQLQRIDSSGTWAKLFDKWLKPVGVAKTEPPKIDRY